MTTLTHCQLAKLSQASYPNSPRAIESVHTFEHVELIQCENTSTECYVCVDGNTIVVVFRGTELDVVDFITDVKIWRVKYHIGKKTKVHAGFYEAWLSIREAVDEILNSSNFKEVIFTGHSLGGALACLAATDYEKPCSVVTFGQPRVGNKRYARLLEKGDIKYTRYINDGDAVVNFPLSIRFRHADPTLWYKGPDLIKNPNRFRLLFKFFSRPVMRIFDHKIRRYVDKLCSKPNQ